MLDDVRRRISFIINTDGVSPFNSLAFAFYPVWIMVANLESADRNSYKDLSLGALLGGFAKPDWLQKIKPLECQLRRL